MVYKQKLREGEFTISSGGGSPETINNPSENRNEPWENQKTTTTTTDESESQSAKGMKAAVEIAIGGGTVYLGAQATSNYWMLPVFRLKKYKSLLSGSG